MVDNNKLREELILSENNKEITVYGWVLICEIARSYGVKRFKDLKVREDIIDKTLTDILENKRWMGYKPDVSKNAYAYIAQIVLCNFARHKMKLYRERVANK